MDTILGFVGVAILLSAFVSNLFGALQTRSRLYQSLNVAGAGLCAWAAWLIPFYPFVLLEGAWAGVALAALVMGAPPAKTAPTDP